MRSRAPLLGVIAAACLASAARADPATAQVGLDAYRRAEAMQTSNILPKVLDLTLAPVWLPDGDRFWYRRELPAGAARYVAVDPATGHETDAFDHARLAAAIAAATGKPEDPDRLNLGDLAVLDASARHIAFDIGGKALKCDLAASVCLVAPPAPGDRLAIVSPDGGSAVIAKDDDLWLRDTRTGAERRLTHDGEPHFAYGRYPDAALLRVLQATSGLKLPPFGVAWSPDSRFLVVTRADERAIPDYDFLQMLPYDGSRRPRVVAVRAPLSGEAEKGALEVSIIDVASGGAHKLATGKEGLGSNYWWAPDGARFLAMQGGDYSRTETLFEVATATGALRPILSESSPTFLQISPLEYDEPAIRFLPATNEVVWFSQRDGYNHLYLVDAASGRIKDQITKGPWSVQNIIRVDEKARRIWFTAVGREAGEDPYFRHLYTASLDGGGPRLVTPGAADHSIPGRTNPAVEQALTALGVHSSHQEMISPSGRYVVDPASAPDRPPVFTLRRADGAKVAQIEAADATAAVAAGWRFPESFVAKAADGKSDVYGLIIKPAGFDPARRYPVIEDIYNGPQVVTTPHDFPDTMSGLMSLTQGESFAQLGFVVVMMDGRGTPMRTKAFQDYMFDNMQEFAVEDHVAAIRELGAMRPWMDMDRIGVFGHSFGGYSSMKAILGYPDFYRVAASSAGPYDMYAMYPLDAFFSPPTFRDGASAPTSVDDHPRNWGNVDLTAFAGRLKGDLLLAYGDLDQNAYPEAVARMINALVAANKEFELIYLPNRSHAFVDEPYYIRRRWDFFVRKLLRAEPPRDYAFGHAP